MVISKRNLLERLSLETVDGIGPKLASILADLEIFFVADLIEHYPHRYLDLSKIEKIGHLREGDEVTVIGEVKDKQIRLGRRGRMQILTVTIFDGTGYISGVWFNQAYIADKLAVGDTVVFSGKAQWRFKQLQMQNPFYDLLDKKQMTDSLNTGRIIPVHSATAQLSATRIRRLIKTALVQFSPDIRETLPTDIRKRNSLVSLATALNQIHFPDSCEELVLARKRLVFEEFFTLQLGLALRKRYLANRTTGIRHKISGQLLDKFYTALPWQLTADQQRALKDIRVDMESPGAMHRLLLGEVGSGKTVVAAAAMLMAVESGRQAAIMVPTEILAEQHYLNLKELFSGLGLKIVIILGGQTGSKRGANQSLVAAGGADIIIGTQSLIQEKVDFARLGVIIIDEQHRFGVRQRLELRAKGANPDMLVLTATPIPRTLALTLYGDLDISLLKIRPGGKSIDVQVLTKYISEGKRSQAYKLIRKEATGGRRTFIVCPLIDESDKLEAKSVLREADNLKTKIFPDLRVGLLHGRMPPAEKEAVMAAFRRGDLDILISTTVIEVGIDIPEATVMMIEHVERFGLSQLHQLRGRVGRGSWPSYCLLLGNIKTDDARARVKALLSISDGFKLAEMDLEIRGEGQLFGMRQSGLPDLKLAKLIQHAKVLDIARREAFALAQGDPKLSKPEHAMLKAVLRHKFTGNLEWLRSG